MNMDPESAILEAQREIEPERPVRCRWIPDHWCKASAQVCEPCLAEKYNKKAHDLARVCKTVSIMRDRIEDLDSKLKQKGKA